MLIPIFDLFKNFNITPRNILHIGAHLAEESKQFDKYFNCPIVWIEAQSELCTELRKRLNPDSNTVI